MLLLARAPAADSLAPVADFTGALAWYPLAGSAEEAVSSPDLQQHRAVYRRREDVSAILRTRPVFSTALACTPQIRQQGLPVLLADLAMALGPMIPCTATPPSGPRLSGAKAPDPAPADELVDTLGGGAACLLADTGLLTTGVSLQAAVDLAAQVETLAQIHCQVAQLRGQPSAISGERA
jgi:L-fuculose-phosphate aldolase